MRPPIETIWSFDDLLRHAPPNREYVQSPERLCANTPTDLHKLLQYAAVWGVSDDGCRAQLIDNASDIARWNLRWIADQHEELLEAWLTGPEADERTFSDAYIAFSSLLMASDEISVRELHARPH